MGTFLLLLFIFFFVVPVVRVAYTVYKVRKKMRDAMNGIYGAQQNQNSGGRQQRKAGWSTPDARAKKIGKDVGDYVAFEDLPAESGAGNTASTSERNGIATEQQITDADWEDLK